MDIPTALVHHDASGGLASVALHVDYGSADEARAEWGRAHLLEHVLVRAHCARSFAVTASTGRERTSYRAVVEVPEVPGVLEQLRGIVRHQREVPPAVLLEEKGVIAREVAERRRTRSWRVRESALRAVWEGTSYAHDPLGSPSDWADTGEAALHATRAAHYRAGAAVLVVAGSRTAVDTVKAEATEEGVFRPPGPAAPLPRGVLCTPLDRDGEDLGHVLAWSDDEAGVQARLLHRMGPASVHQLAVRGGWLTWIWVPPGLGPLRTVRDQLTTALLALSRRADPSVLEHEAEEIRRSERVETAGQDAAERLWAGSSGGARTVREGLKHWASLVEGATPA